MKTKTKETQPWWWSMQVFLKEEDYKDLDDDDLKKVALLQMEKSLLKHMTIKDHGKKGKVCELNGKLKAPEDVKAQQWNSVEVTNLLRQIENLPFESAMYILKHIKLRQDRKEWRDLRNYLKKREVSENNKIVSETKLEWSGSEIPKPVKLTPEQKDWILWEIRYGLMNVHIDLKLCDVGNCTLGIQRDKALYLLTNLCEQDDDNTVLDLGILENFYDRFGKF